MIEEGSSRRKKLKYILIIAILIIIIGIFSVYTHFNNSLNSALKRSLETFNLISVSSTPITDGVELNITYILRNPTEFPIIVETIIISFAVDDVDIGGINISPNKTILASESSYLHFFPSVKDTRALNSLKNDSFKLSITEGSSMSGSTAYLFFHAHSTKSIVYSEIIHNS